MLVQSVAFLGAFGVSVLKCKRLHLLRDLGGIDRRLRDIARCWLSSSLSRNNQCQWLPQILLHLQTQCWACPLSPDHSSNWIVEDLFINKCQTQLVRLHIADCNHCNHESSSKQQRNLSIFVDIHNMKIYRENGITNLNLQVFDNSF